MWFKNLRIYTLTDKFTLTPEELNDALQETAFIPCGKMDMSRYGWVSPLGANGLSLTHAANGYILISAKRQDKVLPSSAIKEQLDEKTYAIESTESRKVGRKERDNLKDEIIFSMLPIAFVKSSVDFAYIAVREKLIVINAASASRSEDLLSALRESLGSLKVLPLTPQEPPTQVMTQWLKSGKLPTDFTFGDECELKAAHDERVIRCKKIDLNDDQLQHHLNTDMYANKLSIHWKEGIQCVIDEQLACKRIKFSDTLVEPDTGYTPDSFEEQFDNDFSIMTLELSAFIKALIKAFGGIVDNQTAQLKE